MRNQPGYLLLFVLIMVFFGCTKPNDNNPGTPPTGPGIAPVDSLFSWKAITQASAKAILDIWFTTRAQGFYASAEGNLYQSGDSGKTWTVIPNTGSPSNAPMENLKFLDQQYGFAQGQQGIEITRDGGVTWSKKPLLTTGGSNSNFLSPSTGYYSDADSGLYKTTDTGNTWKRVFQPANHRQGYYASFVDERQGMLAGSDGFLYKTADSAQSWQLQVSNIPNAPALTYNNLLFLDPLNGFYATSTGLFISTNGGSSWTNTNAQGGSLNVLRFVDAHNGFYMTGSYIFKTTDAGLTWSLSCHLSSDTFIGIYFIDAATGWACTANGIVYRLAE